MHFLFLSGRQDSNLRPPGPKPGALPIAPRPENGFHLRSTLLRNTTPTVSSIVLFCCRGDRIRTCDPLVPNQVRYQLRHAPKTFFSHIRSAFPNERANLVLFFKNSNNFACKNTNKKRYLQKTLRKRLFLLIFLHRCSHSRSHNHSRSRYNDDDHDAYFSCDPHHL